MSGRDASSVGKVDVDLCVTQPCFPSDAFPLTAAALTGRGQGGLAHGSLLLPGLLHSSIQTLASGQGKRRGVWWKCIEGVGSIDGSCVWSLRHTNLLHRQRKRAGKWMCGPLWLKREQGQALFAVRPRTGHLRERPMSSRRTGIDERNGIAKHISLSVASCAQCLFRFAARGCCAAQSRRRTAASLHGRRVPKRLRTRSLLCFSFVSRRRCVLLYVYLKRQYPLFLFLVRPHDAAYRWLVADAQHEGSVA